MPIDVRLLRNDESAESVRHWQQLRRYCKRQDNDHTENWVDTAVRLDQLHREVQKQFDQYKSSCRQERRRPEADKLQSYQKECDDLSTSLREALWSVGNAVDESLLKEMEPTNLFYSYQDHPISKTEATANNLIDSPYGRLIEFGALECVGDLNANAKSSQSGMLCWSNIGLDWSYSLSRFLNESLSFRNTKQVQLLQLPHLLPVEIQDLHDMLGCTLQQDKGCPICTCSKSKNPASNKALISSPSWLAYLNMKYSDETLGDKQLPRVLSYTSTINTNSPANLGTEDVFLDPREDLRQASFSNNHNTPPFLSIHHNIHQVLILTSATWADSRGAQKEWIQRLMSFYQSLICTDTTQSEISNSVKIRERLINPCDLLPGEASRIVVEGHIPNAQSRKALKTAQNDNSSSSNNALMDGDWVILGYISNFLDYPARARRLKNNHHQFCHVLQGTLCSIPETMIWQSQNSMNVPEQGLRISEALAQYFPDHYRNKDSVVDGNESASQAILPQIRSLEKTKHRRLQIQDVKFSSQQSSMGEGETGGDDANQQTSIPLPPTNAMVLTLKQPLTSEQIQHEELTSPFDFLPFYNS